MAKTEKLNQMIAIRRHLKQFGTITSIEAFKKYGCTRLSAKIFDLRKAGWIIDSVPQTGFTRYGDTCQYVMYRYISSPDEKGGK